jgi:hypothetical protein
MCDCEPDWPKIERLKEEYEDALRCGDGFGGIAIDTIDYIAHEYPEVEAEIRREKEKSNKNYSLQTRVESMGSKNLSKVRKYDNSSRKRLFHPDAGWIKGENGLIAGLMVLGSTVGIFYLMKFMADISR